jgi:hypothetical protein
MGYVGLEALTFYVERISSTHLELGPFGAKKSSIFAFFCIFAASPILLTS